MQPVLLLEDEILPVILKKLGMKVDAIRRYSL